MRTRVTSGVRSFRDSLASEVAGHRGTMVDSDVRGSEKLKDRESSLKRLEALLVKIAQEMKQNIGAMLVSLDKLAKVFSEIEQETSTVVVQEDLKREELVAV